MRMFPIIHSIKKTVPNSEIIQCKKFNVSEAVSKIENKTVAHDAAFEPSGSHNSIDCVKHLRK